VAQTLPQSLVQRQLVRLLNEGLEYHRPNDEQQASFVQKIMKRSSVRTGGYRQKACL